MKVVLGSNNGWSPLQAFPLNAAKDSVTFEHPGILNDINLTLPQLTFTKNASDNGQLGLKITTEFSATKLSYGPVTTTY